MVGTRGPASMLHKRQSVELFVITKLLGVEIYTLWPKSYVEIYTLWLKSYVEIYTLWPKLHVEIYTLWPKSAVYRHSLLTLSLVIGGELIKELAVHLHESLQDVVDQGDDGLVPVLLGDAVQGGEHDGQHHVAVLLNQVHDVLIVPEVQCSLCNLEKKTCNMLCKVFITELQALFSNLWKQRPYVHGVSHRAEAIWDNNNILHSA